MADPSGPVPTNLNRASIQRLAEKAAYAADSPWTRPLTEIVRAAGGTVIYRDAWDTDTGDTGAVTVTPNGAFTIAVAKLTSPERDRVSLAREFGHVVLHHRVNRRMRGEPTGMLAVSRFETGRVHDEAACFASAFLMPADALASTFHAESGDLVEVAERFGVPLKTAHARAVEVGLITHASPDAAVQ